MKRKILALAVCLTGAVTAANAATVTLKDGSKMTGTVVSATAQDLQLHTANGMVTIGTDRIRSVDYSDTDSPGAATPALPAAPPADVPSAGMPSAPPADEDYEDQPVRVRRHRAYRRYVRPEYVTPEDEKQFFSLGFGVASPISRVNFSGTGGGTGDNGDSGLYFGTQYAYQLSPRVATGMNIEYMGRSDSGSETLLPDSLTNVSGNSLLIMATAKLSFTDHGPAQPYVLAGLGVNRTSTLITATPNPGFGWSDEPIDQAPETRTLVDDARWGPAETLRVGVDFPLLEPAVFSLEFGWTGISNSESPATQAGQQLGLDHVTGNLSALTFAARWGWRF